MRALVFVPKAAPRHSGEWPWQLGTGENRTQGDGHMRDLKPEEIGHVYGAGGCGRDDGYKRDGHDSGHDKHNSDNRKRESDHGKQSDHGHKTDRKYC